MQVTVDRITALLREKNGQDARSLASTLRQRYTLDIHKREINPLLYGRSDLFERRGTSPPVWYLASAQNRVPTFEAPRTPPARPAPPIAAKAQPFNGTSTPALQPRPVPTPSQNKTPTLSATTPGPTRHEKTEWPLSTLKPYRWQTEAFDWWLDNLGMGIVEAVTGTGKTTIGLAAIALECSRKKRTLLIVPSIVLQDQWADRIRKYIPEAKVVRIGGGNSGATMQAEHDVLIAVVNSAAVWSTQLDGRYELVVADECHRYGATSFRQALLPSAKRRLGLTATLERMDDGVDEALKPYFSSATFTYDFDRATSDRVLASFVVANVGIDLTPAERAEYEQADELCRKARATLINSYGYPADVSDFMTRVTSAAKTMMRLWGEGKYAAQYVSNFSRRIKVLADTPNRLEALLALKPSIALARRTLVFTETVEAANKAATALKRSGVSAEAYHSAIDNKTREFTLQRFREGTLKVVVAVKALDEGVDVPDVNLGIIMSASHQKRQMIQRLGRIVRKKPDDSYAVLVNMFATGTNEDPRSGNHEGFLNAIENGADEIELFPDGCTQAVFDFLEKYLTRKAFKNEVHANNVNDKSIPDMAPAAIPERILRPSAPAKAALETVLDKVQTPPDDRAGVLHTAELTALRLLVDRQNTQIESLEESHREQQERIDELETDLSALENLSAQYRHRVDELTGIVNKLQVILAQTTVKSTPQKKPPIEAPPSALRHPDAGNYTTANDIFRTCRQCGGDGGAGGRCPRCGGNGFEPRD